MATLSPEQIPGLVVRPPLVTPQPGQVIIGYERCRYEAACCNCDGLTMGGVVAIIVILLIFWPLAFIPCLMDDCREEYQRPVYGSPSQAPQGYPVAGQPVAGQPKY
eukprot:TRINITY_DN142_c0_g1_i3.p3 TRINITY_DN142_c0_g1~~TRINITY_DN142_c0_g1_i3.p3  ORF type:complete len:106 (-),score=4.55 TRINITY_DN142_c0_g1_i3:320-637(-)